MTKINDELTKNIFDLWLSKTFSDSWISSSPDYDLDNIGEFQVEIEPEDAKHINEIKSFTVDEEIMGSIRTTYTRK